MGDKLDRGCQGTPKGEIEQGRGAQKSCPEREFLWGCPERGGLGVPMQGVPGQSVPRGCHGRGCPERGCSGDAHAGGELTKGARGGSAQEIPMYGGVQKKGTPGRR